MEGHMLGGWARIEQVPCRRPSATSWQLLLIQIVSSKWLAMRSEVQYYLVLETRPSIEDPRGNLKSPSSDLNFSAEINIGTTCNSKFQVNSPNEGVK
jgi:hypothetical protein